MTALARTIVEKAPAASGWSEEALPDGPLYVRWTYRTYRNRWWWGDDTPPLSSNGHRGWTPEGGERVRVYLASRAHDPPAPVCSAAPLVLRPATTSSVQLSVHTPETAAGESPSEVEA